jgi:hypothetical protein
MNFFKKAINEVKELDKTIESFKETPTPEPDEEWIWVEGYKGTDKDMKCLDFQYELGVQYDMPDGQAIKECKSGFHLCLSLYDVFGYYSIGHGNRFFKVKALVRKTDKNKCRPSFQIGREYYSFPSQNKLAAKSIIFTSELTYDEILKDTDAEGLPEEYKKTAIDISVSIAVLDYQVSILEEDGYSLPFATHMAKTGLFDIAHAAGSQKDLSMDMKVLAILYGKQGEPR